MKSCLVGGVICNGRQNRIEMAYRTFGPKV